MPRRLQKVIATSSLLPQPPDRWVKPIKLYIQLFNNIWGVLEDDRFEARDKAILYLQMVHVFDDDHEVFRDPLVVEFIEDFDCSWKDHKLILPLKALEEVYKPLCFTRIGLRYIDIITRSKLGLNDILWDELIKSYMLGILYEQNLKNNVRNFNNKFEIKLSDNKSFVNIVSSFVKPIESSDNSEISYLIDSDFYIQHKTDIDDAIKQLDYSNIRASRLIQWCITDRLREAMEPEEL